MHCTNHRGGLYIDLRTRTFKITVLTNLQQYCYITNLTYAVANVDCFVDIIWYFNKSLLAHDILQRPLQHTTTYYCIHMLVALSCIWFELMPHNDNYFRNILRQRLRDYSPAGKGSPQKKNNAIQETIYIT